MSAVLVGELLALLLFLGIIAGVLIGYPVAFTIGGVSLAVAGIALAIQAAIPGFEPFNAAFLGGTPSRLVEGVMLNGTFVAVPLFVFMGVTLERSGLAERLLETMGQLFGTLRGGLGLSVVLVGALLAASTGIVGATVVTMGLLSVPAMLRAGYDPKLAAGLVCAAGTLGQIIPPSTVLVFVGGLLQAAQNARPGGSPVSTGDLFAGALLPGLLLVAFYAGWIGLQALLRPASCPAVPSPPELRRTLPSRVVSALLPPLLLILAVLGSILGGIATPTESAAVGALGALGLASGTGRFGRAQLWDVMRQTAQISSMVFTILVGAALFSLVFRGLGGEHALEAILAGLPGGKWGAILAVMLLMFVLGFVLDTFEIVFIVVPITAPALLALGVDPLWLGVMIGVNLQTSFLTPPFGFALFYLRGAVGDRLATADIHRGVLPFVALQLLALATLAAVPEIVTWLPRKLNPVAEGRAAGAPTLEDALREALGDDDLPMPPFRD